MLGGRTVTTERPRGRNTDGTEIELDTWKVFSSKDLLDSLVVERMLAGVATRRHQDVAEPVGADIEERPGPPPSPPSPGASWRRRRRRSASSRRGASPTSTWPSLMIDGLEVASQCCVVALVITADGTKVPVGLWLGDTENKTVVTALLADLVARGLSTDGGVLVMIDGAKALAAGVKKVFGEAARVQRCTFHKRRNVAGHLPKDLAATVDRRLAVIFAQPNPDKGLDAAKRLATELEADHPDAAASACARDSTTCSASGASASGHTGQDAHQHQLHRVDDLDHPTHHGPGDRWKDGKMKKRWVAAGMLEAERSFRRVRGHKDMGARLRSSPRDRNTARTTTKYDQAAA